METLKYIIEDSTIAELLGIQNFTNKEAAVLEIVKNAFDAQATKLDIQFENDIIKFIDNGIGMNEDDIRANWMHIGKSNKLYEVKDMDNKTRVLAGSKGVGRFALSRLGEKVELESKKREANEHGVKWKTDWNETLLESYAYCKNVGTKIEIFNLRDKWSKKEVKKLLKYLNKTYNDDLMEINVNYHGEEYKVEKIFHNPKIGENFVSEILLEYKSDNGEVICKVISDEFTEEANKYCHGKNLKEHDVKIDIYNELRKEFELSDSEFKSVTRELGDFTANLYFSLRNSLAIDMKRFCYKYKQLINRYEEGIILYRNSFSIASFEGTKDWLNLGKRARKSPAAATHPTGSWRVRENNISGSVNIDKKINLQLKDLSNRQGFDENIYYELFVKILDLGLKEFERYRQEIIREINKKNKEKESEKKIIDKVLNDPKYLNKLSITEQKEFIVQIKDYKNENADIKREMSTNEERYKYDVRILNILATVGLKASSIAHEMHNDRNSVNNFYEDIILAMKEFKIWDYVNEPERKRYAYLNIPQMLENNNNINSRIVAFMDTMLTEIEKKQFIVQELDIMELINKIKVVWENDYSWIKIDIDNKSELSYKLSEDVIRVIFDNLILNSIQQNDDLSDLEISIHTELRDGVLLMKYRDSGEGLDDKYKRNPMRILEVHETSRNNGHGLGMWIINNTINMLNGKIIKINGESGFEIEFTLGGVI